MYNFDPVGVLTVRTEISDYVHTLVTNSGTIQAGSLKMDKSLVSICAKSVVSHHLFRLFAPIKYNGIYTVVNDIMNNLMVEKICLNEGTIDLLAILLENEVRKACVYVFDVGDYNGINVVVNSIKMDLMYLYNNLLM